MIFIMLFKSRLVDIVKIMLSIIGPRSDCLTHLPANCKVNLDLTKSEENGLVAIVTGH